MRKKVLFATIVLLPLISIIFSMQSCLKDELFFTYRYMIVQTLSNDQPTKDTIIPVEHAGLRIWIVPERYYDRFASIDNPFITSAYAEGVFEDTDPSEENDSIMSINLWTTIKHPNETYDSTIVANSHIRYKVDGEKEWMNRDQAISTFNSRANTNNVPQYIEIEFDRFFKYKGYGFFSVHLETKKRGEENYMFARSNSITLN